ncbi:MAG: hypothetical protein IPJ71_17290 [Bdellovibrionales bacterium]|nr:hypothetical protein [Bdellovibrionales bacterium]
MLVKFFGCLITLSFSLSAFATSNLEKSECVKILKREQIVWSFESNEVVNEKVLGDYLDLLSVFAEPSPKTLKLSLFEYERYITHLLSVERLEGPWVTDELLPNLLVAHPELEVSQIPPNSWHNLQGPPPRKLYLAKNRVKGTAAYFAIFSRQGKIIVWPLD